MKLFINECTCVVVHPICMDITKGITKGITQLAIWTTHMRMGFPIRVWHSYAYAYRHGLLCSTLIQPVYSYIASSRLISWNEWHASYDDDYPCIYSYVHFQGQEVPSHKNVMSEAPRLLMSYLYMKSCWDLEGLPSVDHLDLKWAIRRSSVNGYAAWSVNDWLI